MKSFVKKHCNFCGEPMPESGTECNQCGWDRSQDGAPTADPADKKARIGVALGLAVAYYVMFSLVNNAEARDRPPRPTVTARVAARTVTAARSVRSPASGTSRVESASWCSPANPITLG